MNLDKGAGIIHQCTRCYTLRVPDRRPCKTCQKQLGEVHTATRPLPIGDLSSDASPVDDFISLAPMGTYNA